MHSAPQPSALPAARIDRALDPLKRFIAIESASGVLLLIAAAVALALANSPWAESFQDFWKTHFRMALGPWAIDESLLHWVNDGLMTIFFFVIGLEIKREIVDGELSDPRKASLPLMAAIGGMVAPALVYMALIGNDEGGQSGWGIPMATDIAFVVGFLALFGRRVPPGLKILLLALAIVDDIGAILVIAIFYSDGTSIPASSLAVSGLAVTVACHWLGVRSFGVYVLIGAAVWLAMFHTGIHPTIAGVILGLLTPARPMLPRVAVLDALTDSISADETETPHAHLAAVDRLKTVAQETVSPLERLETALHPWVAFVIMPLFALANAGVPIDPRAVNHPVAWSVAAGLFVGKPLGILLFSWLAVRLRVASLPHSVSWRMVAAASCLAGIGFTMSLFIAALALDDAVLSAGKIGTILGSILSAVVGLVLLHRLLPSASTSPA